MMLSKKINTMKKFSIFRQHDSMQCGIACLQMVCKYFGREYSLDSLSKLCFATAEGVSLLGINEAANTLGLHKIHATFRCQPPSELQYHTRLLHWHMPTAYHWGIPKQDDHHRWLFPFRDRESLQRQEIPSLGDSEIYFP